jgi:D-alanyl-D-alanine carboxypeptidase (penicillin-binding protein 5/6)
MPRSLAALVAAFALVAPLPAQPDAPKKAAADLLDGPPYVTAKAWAVADGKTGKLVRGFNEAEARPMASTSKIMTAWLVLRLAAADEKVLAETVIFSERADKTTGSSAELNAGEKVSVGELLYGLLLPSGNDAAVALAEHFGGRFGDEKEGDAHDRFVAELNRRARALELKEMAFKDPHGLSPGNVSSARDLATLAHEAMKDERFRKYVGTRRHETTVKKPDGTTRAVAWANTNRLLDVEGYEGVKTGTTTPAGACLVASSVRGDDRLIVVVLGATSADARYTDSRNLFRWAWLERGHKPAK